MTVGRRSARRQAVFALYRQDLLGRSAEAVLSSCRDGFTGETDSYLRQLVLGTTAKLELIDQLLGQHLSDWSLERLGVLERSILRVAVYELVAEETVPPAVVIDEAVSLAKRYCSVEAGALVNGVLGSLVSTIGKKHADEH